MARDLKQRLQTPAHATANSKRHGSRAELLLALALLAAFTSLMAFFAIALGSVPFMVLVALWGGSATVLMAAAWTSQA